MRSGGLAPGAMLASAVWLGALLRLSQAALYANDWAVRIPADAEAVERIAQEHGFTNLGQVGPTPVRSSPSVRYVRAEASVKLELLV